MQEGPPNVCVEQDYYVNCDAIRIYLTKDEQRKGACKRRKKHCWENVFA